MKLPRLLPVLSLVALALSVAPASADSFDSETATVQKGGNDKTAKVMVGKATYMAPITFADGADWSAVKDHYEIADSVVAGLEKHKIAISIGSDGTASFTRTK